MSKKQFDNFELYSVIGDNVYWATASIHNNSNVGRARKGDIILKLKIITGMIFGINKNGHLCYMFIQYCEKLQLLNISKYNQYK